jgi:hypothetical protein
MHRNKWLPHMMGLTLILLFLVACVTSPPTTTSTPVPPTATSTPVPPTATPTPVPTVTPELPVKILFIGNSLTYWNRGLDQHIEQLAGSANPPLVIEADAAVMSDVPLEKIWKNGKASELIGTGDYDVVVLQEGLALTDMDTFHEYVCKFDAEIKETGAKTVLFMAWPVRISELTIEEIAEANRDIATELGVDVAPVGLAWQRAMEERPELNMYYLDGIHPSLHGTYLAINVVYATIFGKSPSGIAYLPSLSGRGRVTEDEAAFLQRIAWETVKEYWVQQ